MENLKIGKREGSKFGTARAEELLRRLGDPDKKLKIIHVAGSNGKGSVCAYLTNILLAAGFTVGCFTSPPVYSYSDQFYVNGRPAADGVLQSYLSYVRSAAEGMEDAPSQFETEVCAALAMFAGEGCLWCVLECGLGGLYDATNAVSRKELAVITSVALEHTDVLGSTIKDICRHKGGIIKNCPAVIPDNMCAEARDYFAAMGAKVAGAGLKVTRRTAYGQYFSCGGRQYYIHAFGDEQAYNAALAAECAAMLGIPAGAVSNGLKNTRLAGRVQIFRSGGRRYIVDGGHNPQALSPLAQTAGGMGGTKSLVYTCLADKDVNGCAAALGGLFGEVIIFPAPSGRAMDVGKISAAFQPYNKNVRICADVKSAIEGARGHTVAVCGSFTILKEAKNWIEQRR